MSADPMQDAAGPSRLRQENVTDVERNYSVAMHLTPLAGVVPIIGQLAIFIPLVLWLLRREESAFNDDHGRETINMLITSLIFGFGLVFIPVIGWLALVAWLIVILVGMIRGAMAAGRGEYFRYPMIIRLIPS